MKAKAIPSGRNRNTGTMTSARRRAMRLSSVQRPFTFFCVVRCFRLM
jgi:hypothetical protein